jgi:hypothetical protein
MMRRSWIIRSANKMWQAIFTCHGFQPSTDAFVLAQRELEKRRSPLVHRFRPFGAGIF